MFAWKFSLASSMKDLIMTTFMPLDSLYDDSFADATDLRKEEEIFEHKNLDFSRERNNARENFPPKITFHVSIGET